MLGVGIGIGAALGLACGTETRAVPRTERGSPPPISGEAVLERLVAFGAQGPRTSGSDAARRARDYLERELDRLGLAVQRVELRASAGDGSRFEVVHLVSRIPGTLSSDIFLLAAPYTHSWEPDPAGRCHAASHGGSGAALLLELAAALVAHPLPYATWVVFVDEGAAPGTAPLAGSVSLARALDEQGDLERIRLAVFVEAVGEARLRVARDLRSHRTFRERFFQVASKLGYARLFPPSAGFESSVAGHQAFAAQGNRRVVALIGREAATDGSGPETVSPSLDPAAKLRDVCSPESLAAVGHVQLVALEELASILNRLDTPRGGVE